LALISKAKTDSICFLSSNTRARTKSGPFFYGFVRAGVEFKYSGGFKGIVKFRGLCFLINVFESIVWFVRL